MTVEEFRTALNGNFYSGNIKVHVGKNEYWLHADQLDKALDTELGAMMIGFYVKSREGRGLIKGRRNYNYFHLKNATLLEKAKPLTTTPPYLVVEKENLPYEIYTTQ